MTPQVNFALLFGGFGEIIALDFYVDSGMAIITYATSAAAKAALVCLQSSEIIVEGASEILHVELSDDDAINRGSNADERKRQDKAENTVIKPASVYMCNEAKPYLAAEKWATTGSGQLIGPERSNLFVRNIPFHMSESELAAHFAPYGRLLSVTVYVDLKTRRSKGFGKFCSLTSNDLSLNLCAYHYFCFFFFFWFFRVR